MNTIRAMTLSSRGNSSPQPPSGANLSKMKLGHGPQRITLSSVPSAKPTAHVLRQFSAVAVVALLALGVMFIACDPAGASFPIINPPQDPPAKDDEQKPDPKDVKKPTIKRDVKNVKELELPPPVVEELMRGTRPHRDPVPELRIEKKLVAPEPTQDELRKFGDFKKAGGLEIKSPEDVALIDKVVKSQVYSLTDPKWFQPDVDARKTALERMRKNRDEIEKVLEAKGGMNEKFVSIFKQSAMKYLAELLDNNVKVRVNAMILLGMVKDEATIRLFVAQIDDPKQHEAVKFLAIEGIESLGRQHLINEVQLESMAVTSLLNTLKKGDQVHPFTRQAAVRALGAIGRPTRVVGRNDAEIAVALLKILRDPNIRRLDRKDAMVALANLQIQPELDFNFQYVAYEIAQFAADVGAAALQDPSTDDLHSHLYLVDAAYALAPDTKAAKSSLAASAKKHAKASAQGDPAYVRAFGEQVYKLTGEALTVYKPDTTVGKAAAPPKEKDVVKKTLEIKEGLRGPFATQLDALNKLIKEKPPRSMQLTPDTAELGPPPALAGPNAPVAKEAEENGKPKAGDKPAASTSGPGQ